MLITVCNFCLLKKTPKFYIRQLLTLLPIHNNLFSCIFFILNDLSDCNFRPFLRQFFTKIYNIYRTGNTQCYLLLIIVQLNYFYAANNLMSISQNKLNISNQNFVSTEAHDLDLQILINEIIVGRTKISNLTTVPPLSQRTVGVPS